MALEALGDVVLLATLINREDLSGLVEVEPLFLKSAVKAGWV